MKKEEELKKIVLNYLENNYDENLNKKIMYYDLQINIKDERKIANKIYDEYVSAKLNYTNESHFITKISKTLEKLINDYNLDFDLDNNIVLLTKRNSKIIENIIENDDNYFPFSYTLYKYFIEKYGIEGFKRNEGKSLYALIREIDRDNSTNVWRYKNHRDAFNKCIAYIVNPKNQFFEKLEKGDSALPDIIVNECGSELKSLSSKICKYLAEWMYPSSDKYYINDKFVRHVLLFYLDLYKVDKEVNGKEIDSSSKVDNLSYSKLFILLEKLNEESARKHKQEKLSKSCLDHILWYCYKSFIA